MIRKWVETSRKSPFLGKIFRYYQVERKSTDKDIQGAFDIIECRNSVCVIALKGEGDEQIAVMVKQYRHGSDQLTLEFPAGTLEPGEDPLLACKRELKEETGHTSNNWTYLTRSYFNPALLTNYCDIYFAKDVVRTSEIELDELEEIEVVEISLKELESRIGSDELSHSLTASSLYFLNRYLDKKD